MKLSPKNAVISIVVLFVVAKFVFGLSVVGASVAAFGYIIVEAIITILGLPGATKQWFDDEGSDDDKD